MCSAKAHFNRQLVSKLSWSERMSVRSAVQVCVDHFRTSDKLRIFTQAGHPASPAKRGRGANRNGVGWGAIPWEGTLGSPKGSHGKGPMGGEPLGAQGIPWKESRTPHEGNPWEPKGSHGRGTLGSPRDPMGGDPMGEDPWEPKGLPYTVRLPFAVRLKY